MTDLLPIHLTTPQLDMLRQIAFYPQSWHVTQVKAERKALDELVTLRLARCRGEGAERQWIITVYGLSELQARGE